MYEIKLILSFVRKLKMTESEYKTLEESAKVLSALNVTTFLAMILSKTNEWIGVLEHE